MIRTSDNLGKVGSGAAAPFAARAWHDSAEALAIWAWRRLVNRTDARGGYRPREEWGREYTRRDGTTGKLGQTTTRKGALTPAILAAHFRARWRSDLVGLHSTSPAGTSRWGFVDIDWHGPTSTAPQVNRAAALHWYGELARQRFRPVLLDSNGRGGFHLGFVLRDPAPTPAVYHFLRRLTADHAHLGLPRPPECFPKQAALGPGRRYGNWLRLAGKHHSAEHWTRVWDGGRWLAGAEAVAWLLSVEGDDPALLPPVLPEARPAVRPASPGPHIFVFGAPAGPTPLSARVAAYLRHLPNLAEGQGRDDVAYQFAAFLVRDLSLGDDVALGWLERWDSGNSPPKGREALAEILGNARRYGRNAEGCGLAPRPRARACPGRPRARGGHAHTTLSFRLEVR